MKYKIGDAVKIRDSVFGSPLSDGIGFLKEAWGFIAKSEAHGNLFECYWVFFPQYPAETEATEPTVIDLSYILYEVELEPLNEAEI